MELALNYSFAMLAHLVPTETLTKSLESGLDIVIAGNNDFYSQRKEVTSKTLDGMACSAKKQFGLTISQGSQAQAGMLHDLTLNFCYHLQSIIAQEERATPQHGIIEADPTVRLHAHNTQQSKQDGTWIFCCPDHLIGRRHLYPL